MFGGEHVQTGAGRYYQHHGALKRLGEETSYYGKKIFLLYADETVKGKTSQRAEESLNQAGLEYTSMVFEGASTAKSFQKVAEELKSWGAEVVVGIGGGRVIDIAKAWFLAIFLLINRSATTKSWLLTSAVVKRLMKSLR